MHRVFIIAAGHDAVVSIFVFRFRAADGIREQHPVFVIRRTERTTQDAEPGVVAATLLNLPGHDDMVGMYTGGSSDFLDVGAARQIG